jgi:hypothetical protein
VYNFLAGGKNLRKEQKMHVVLVFVLPAFFFMGVGFFIHMFKQGVKDGIYQKSVAPKKDCPCGGNCTCKKGKQ